MSQISTEASRIENKPKLKTQTNSITTLDKCMHKKLGNNISTI